MHGRGHPPRPESVEWMTLVARHVRSSTDPGAAVIARRDVARTVVVGGEDVFLPARALAPVVRGKLGVELDVLASAGHLVIDEVPEALADLAAGDG
jgi:pimeloyl-ACP methyl ester carboxylesterase